MANPQQFRTWTFGNPSCRTSWKLGEFPKLMGILNITPDSFSDGGEFFEPDRAVEQGLKLVDQGADILDLGGESTRPGSAPVEEAEELRRVIPVIERLAQSTQVPISIDTTKSRVAAEALQAGATIVNDISGLTFDAKMIDVCAETDAGVICMHIQGTPQTMQAEPHYDNAVQEICDWLQERLNVLKDAGISQERVVLDPGIGFGKTAQHNLEILSHIADLRKLGCPVLVGHSRKRFLKKVLGREVNERTFGTVGVAVALAMQQTDILRVHDVLGTRDTLTAWKAILDAMPTTDC